MTHNKIKSLTPDQAADLPIFRKHYFDIACSGERADRTKLQSAINDAYAAIGKPSPRLFIFDSPTMCMMALKIFDIPDDGQLGDQLGDQLWGQLRDQLQDQLWGQLRGQLWGQKVWNPSFLWGSHDLYWIAWGKFAEKIGVRLTAETSNKLGETQFKEYTD